MGFLGDVLSGIFDGDGSESFGQRIRSDNEPLRDLYEHTYFNFGLMPPRNLKENQFVPMTTSGYKGRNLGFEIHGNIMSPMRFFSRSWGNPFHTIEHNFPPMKGRVWAFDITRLHEGILVGDAVYPGDEAYVRSEEFLKMLRIIGNATLGLLDEIPKIELDFGNTWSKYGIPDRIHIAMKHMRPFSDNDLQKIINMILHAYNRSDAPPVTAHYSTSLVDGIITLENRENVAQPAAQAPTQAPHVEPATQADPDDGFPYDFYRGLGLINDDNTVTVPSMLGPVNADMRDPLVKQFLLEYKP